MKSHFETTTQEESFAEVTVKKQNQQKSQWPTTLSCILKVKNLFFLKFKKSLTYFNHIFLFPVCPSHIRYSFVLIIE